MTFLGSISLYKDLHSPKGFGDVFLYSHHLHIVPVRKEEVLFARVKSEANISTPTKTSYPYSPLIYISGEPTVAVKDCKSVIK